MSLYLQQLRGLSALATGVVFVPMMLIGGIVTLFTARLAERFGARTLITGGLLAMMTGLAAIALMPAATPVAALSALMILVGLHGLRVSLLIAAAAAVALAAAAAVSLLIKPANTN